MNRFVFVLNIFLSLLVWTSCSRASDPAKNEETMTVSLNLTGDFDVDVSQDPLTRAGSSNDAYAINVTYDNGRYAYGLFDNVGDMTITLLSNHKYTFECTLIKDARNTLFFGQAFNNTFSGYAYPFQTNSSNSTMISNSFIVGSGTYFTGFDLGSAHLASTTSPSTSNATSYPSTNRFYGRTTNYEPVQNGVINIYLKRAVFGARFVVSGVQEGNLRLQCGAFFDRTISASGNGTYESVYTFTNPATVALYDTPLVATLSANFTSSRGNLWNLTQTQDIQFKRNIMTTVYVQLNPDLSAATITTTEEEMDDDNIINMGINTDGLIDIIVNPED